MARGKPLAGQEIGYADRNDTPSFEGHWAKPGRPSRKRSLDLLNDNAPLATGEFDQA
jgi:hypothetical protein